LLIEIVNITIFVRIKNQYFSAGMSVLILANLSQKMIKNLRGSNSHSEMSKYINKDSSEQLSV
jgi:hypothetical protein